MPLSTIAVAGVALLLGGALFWRVTSVQGIARDVSWSIFGFVAGMFVMVAGVEQVGLTDRFARGLRAAAALGAGGRHGPTVLSAVLAATFGSAVGSNLINNVPMAVVMTSTIHHFGPVIPPVHLALIGGTIFGCDLGPNVTTVGSLATILWMLLLRRRGVEVSALEYFKIRIVVAPVLLAAGAFGMWFMLRL